MQSGIDSSLHLRLSLRLGIFSRLPILGAALAILVFCPAFLGQRTSSARRHSPVPLGTAIDRLLSEPSNDSSHWGISVVSLDGKPIYARNDAESFHPASNAKLFTTAAAYALLPGNLVFTTQAVAHGAIDAAGTLHGDLVLLGAGDANISGRTIPYDGATERPNPPLAALDAMADQIVRRGIHSIAGDIVGDDTWFLYEPYATGWEWDDLQWGYGAPVSALTVNDNLVFLNVAPGTQAGEAPIASWLPATAYYTLENSLVTVVGGEPQYGIDRQPGSLVVRVFGQIERGGNGIHAALAIEDPADFAARSLKEMLIARGIQVTGAARARHRLPSATGDFLAEQNEPLELRRLAITNVAAPTGGDIVLASHPSPPLSQDLVVTNKVSQNLHAELLLRTLGKLEGTDGSLPEGTRVVRQFLTQAGIDPGDFLFYDGSGLSPQDLVTPRAFTALLVYAAHESWGDAFRSSLPVGGVDGSLSSRFTEPPLKGRIFAKTGTLAEIGALSGYLVAASGRTVAFSILCDDHRPASEAGRETIDKIAEAIAAAN